MIIIAALSTRFFVTLAARWQAWGYKSRLLMSGSDWRSARAYEYVSNLSPASFAWEFLRRNGEYRADYANSEFRSALETGAAGPERRWGLRFRG